jgi:FtsH-binding integral membrane protein
MDMGEANWIDIDPEIWEFIQTLIPFLIPLVLIQLGLLIFVIIDIARKKNTKHLPPVVWIIIALSMQMLGSILYIVFGRADKKDSDDDDI